MFILIIYVFLCFIYFVLFARIFSETEVTTTRPFGQPLCFVNENGDPPPSILKPTASVRKKNWLNPLPLRDSRLSRLSPLEAKALAQRGCSNNRFTE